MINAIRAISPTYTSASNARSNADFAQKGGNWLNKLYPVDNTVLPATTSFDALPKNPLTQALTNRRSLGPLGHKLVSRARAARSGNAQSHGASWRAPSQMAAEMPPILSMTHGHDTLEAIHDELPADNPIQADAVRRTRIPTNAGAPGKKPAAQSASADASQPSKDHKAMALRAQARAFATIPGLADFRQFYRSFEGAYAVQREMPHLAGSLIR